MHVLKFNITRETTGTRYVEIRMAFTYIRFIKFGIKGLELPSANGGRFEIKKLLFADD